MKIAIDTSPLDPRSGHSVRGVGSYLRSIVENVEKYDRSNSYAFIPNRKYPKNVDLIHIPYFDPFRIEIPFRTIRKSIITIHDLTPVLFPEYFPSGIKGSSVWKVQKMILKHAAGIITDSVSSAEDINRIIGVHSKKIFPVLLTGSKNYFPLTDQKKVKEVIGKYGLPEKFALYVGDVTWNKNVPFIIESCISANIPLVLIGKALTDRNFDRANPWNKDRIRVQKHFELNQHLLYPLGFVEDQDLNMLYNAAQVLLMPSKYEGFGLPVLEAMQAGCPVITSRSGSLVEVGGDAVVYVDPDDKNEMIGAIMKIFGDSKKRSELSKKGIVQSKKFGLERMIHETVGAYEKVYSQQ